METKTEIDYSKAKEIIKEKLMAKGIVFEKNEYNLIIKGARVEFNHPSSYYSFHRSYQTVNLTIVTEEYSNRKRLFLRRFDVLTGDYDLLVEKIKTIQSKNKEINKTEIKKANDKTEKYNELMAVLKPFGATKKWSESIEVDLKEFDLEFAFYPESKDYAKVSCYFRGGEDEAIKLIKFLKTLKKG